MKIRAAICLIAVLLTGCAKHTSAVPGGDAAASEAAAARASVPTTAATTEGEAAIPVKAPPMPSTFTKNPIYRVGKLPSSGCKEPNYQPTSLANVRAYYTEFTACLNKVWAPVIQKAGFRFVPPKLVVVLGQSPSSPCTVEDGRDYYCGDTIYMDAKPDIDGYRDAPASQRMWMALTMGHEYGHHVQALTGMLRAMGQRHRTLNNVDAYLEDERRLELQASCFSAVYLGADRNDFPLTGSALALWKRVAADTVDDDHDHGKAANHSFWTTAGYDAASPAGCNTYVAPSWSVT
ncbi:neutral zinc metallopeptidase [Kribbella sp. NPDC026611]|uniref:neutral zinc metallopeptidase n=1 Tax=Kribbella sp. NPDC026611 TaxID=3154911 RepID=UPI0034087D3A